MGLFRKTDAEKAAATARRDAQRASWEAVRVARQAEFDADNDEYYATHPIIVRMYRNSQVYSEDAASMALRGYRPILSQGAAQAGGKVSLSGTAAKLALTGGLGAITGMSRQRAAANTEITVTYERANGDNAAHA
jgi:hypothetical protein